MESKLPSLKNAKPKPKIIVTKASERAIPKNFIKEDIEDRSPKILSQQTQKTQKSPFEKNKRKNSRNSGILENPVHPNSQSRSDSAPVLSVSPDSDSDSDSSS